MGNIRFQPPEGPLIDLYSFFFMFSSFNKYLSMKWYALQGGPNDFLLATSQLLIQIKMTLTYTQKYRIFTAMENYLNT